jgi:DnaK suppressor protein
MDESQLAEIERRLLRERERTQRSLNRFHEENRRSLESADFTGRSASPFEVADQTAEAAERDRSFLLASKEGRYLYRLEDALRRLYQEPEAFGRCQRCGREIPFERLFALPHTRYCLDCKRREEEVAAA